MPSWIEFRLASSGLLRLARFDPDFPRVLRSLARRRAAQLLAVPCRSIRIYLLAALELRGAEPHPPNLTQFLAAMSVGYLYLWLVPPLRRSPDRAAGSAAMPRCRDASPSTTGRACLNVGAAVPTDRCSIGGRVQPILMSILDNVVLLVTLVMGGLHADPYAASCRFGRRALAAIADSFITHCGPAHADLSGAGRSSARFGQRDRI